MKLKNYAFLIGIALFVYLLFRTDLPAMWKIIASAKILFLFLGFLLTGLEVVLKAFKLRILMENPRGFTLSDSMLTVLAGLSLGAVSPGKIGDFVKVTTMQKKSGKGLVACLAIVALERFLDLIVIFVMAVFCTLYLFFFFFRSRELLLIDLALLLVAAILALCLAMNRRFMESLFKATLLRMLPAAAGEELRKHFDLFYEQVQDCLHRWRTVTAVMLLGVMWVLMMALRSYLFGLAISLPATFTDMAIFTPIVITVESLPVTVLGIGTREYLMVILFSLINVSREQSIALSLILLALAIIPQIVGGLFVLRKEKS